MNSNTVLFGWKRSLPGREQLSAAHFQDFAAYLTGLQTDGKIEAFEPILLEPNGSSLIGFFLIRGDNAQLNAMTGSGEWGNHMIRAMFHLDDPVLVRGACGPLVGERMAAWSGLIPA